MRENPFGYRRQSYRGRFSPSVKIRILERDNYICIYCDSFADQVDHVLPIKWGGISKTSNGVAACHRCNRNKYSNLDEEIIKKGFTHLLNKGEDMAWTERAVRVE